MYNSKNGNYIFVKWFKHPKTGKILYASNYGKKAFKILLNR